MSMGMEVCIFLAYAAGMLVVYLIGRYMLIPLKWTGRLMMNSLFGGIIIFVINYIGGNLGILLPLNIFTAGITGILGVPGLVMLLVYFA